jgi:hypothetical protein
MKNERTHIDNSSPYPCCSHSNGRFPDQHVHPDEPPRLARRNHFWRSNPGLFHPYEMPGIRAGPGELGGQGGKRPGARGPPPGHPSRAIPAKLGIWGLYFRESRARLGVWWQDVAVSEHAVQWCGCECLLSPLLVSDVFCPACVLPMPVKHVCHSYKRTKHPG